MITIAELQKKFAGKDILFRGLNIPEVLENVLYETGFYSCKIEEPHFFIKENGGKFNEKWVRFEIPI